MWQRHTKFQQLWDSTSQKEHGRLLWTLWIYNSTSCFENWGHEPGVEPGSIRRTQWASSCLMEFSTSSVVTGSQQSGRETPVCGPHTVSFSRNSCFSLLMRFLTSVFCPQREVSNKTQRKSKRQKERFCKLVYSLIKTNSSKTRTNIKCFIYYIHKISQVNTKSCRI